MGYIFTGDIFGGYFFGGYLHEEGEEGAIGLDVGSEILVAVDEDDDPLLDDVGVEGVFFVVDEALLDVSEGLQPDLF
jgi:hypothetical protein